MSNLGKGSRDMKACSIEQWIQLNSITAGKDKIARLIQYLSRFLWYYIEKRKDLRDVVTRLKIIESSLSTFRKILRLGKSLDVLYGALKTLHLADAVVRFTTTASRIYQCLFLASDHLIWLSRAGLINLDKNKLTLYSCRFWLGSLICNLIRDAYEIRRVLKTSNLHSMSACHSKTQLSVALYQAKNFVEQHPDLFWDSIKNGCDLFIPLTTLGKTSLSPGVIGFLGTLSSVAGLVALLNPRAKLGPA